MRSYMGFWCVVMLLLGAVMGTTILCVVLEFILLSPGKTVMLLATEIGVIFISCIAIVERDVRNKEKLKEARF